LKHHDDDDDDDDDDDIMLQWLGRNSLGFNEFFGGFFRTDYSKLVGA